MAKAASTFDLDIPCTAETAITGYVATVRFTRFGHDYTARIMASPGVNTYKRDGKPLEWATLPTAAKRTVNKAIAWLNAAAALRNANGEGN